MRFLAKIEGFQSLILNHFDCVGVNAFGGADDVARNAKTIGKFDNHLYGLNEAQHMISFAF